MYPVITSEVPKITLTGNVASSNAAMPRHEADQCACWDDKSMRTARRLVAMEGTVQCQDATAWVALTALKLEMLHKGRDVKVTLVKAWEN